MTTSVNCWNNFQGMTKVKDPHSRLSSSKTIIQLGESLTKHYRTHLSIAFDMWRKWGMDYGRLLVGTRVQQRGDDNRWYWGEIYNLLPSGLYEIRLDDRPEGIYTNVDRTNLKPLTRLVRSGQIIDWNFVDPPQRERLVEKWGRRCCASDFD